MTTKFGTALFFGALAAFIVCGTVQAQAPGQGDFFTLHFDENGHGAIDFRDGTGNHPDPGFAAVDPNTGVLALTYLLGGNIGPGVVDIFDTSGALSDAIDFYNIGANGYMAFYSTLPGTDLADTLSGGFVPLGFAGPTEVGDNFAYFSGGVPGVNNDYYGISGGGQVPDGGSTVALLGFALAGLGILRRKLGC